MGALKVLLGHLYAPVTLWLVVVDPVIGLLLLLGETWYLQLVVTTPILVGWSCFLEQNESVNGVL